MQGQRVLLGDKMVKLVLNAAIRIAQKKAKDKEEFDRVLKEHQLFQEFCQEIGLKI